MGNVYEGGENFLMPNFLDGPGLKDALKRSFKSKVARQFNKVFPNVPGRVRIQVAGAGLTLSCAVACRRWAANSRLRSTVA